jgi:hypothetical protein
VQDLGTTGAGKGEFLTCFNRLGRNRCLTLALVAVLDLGLSTTALNLADQVTTGAIYHMVFSFLGLGLGGWVSANHSVSYLLLTYPRPRTLSGSSESELMPLQTV